MKTKLLVFIILPIVLTIILNKMNAAKPIKYIESSSELDGKWLELPTKSRAIDSITFGNGVFVGVGEGIIGHSANGRNWEFYMDQDGPSDILNDVIYADDRFVAVGNGIIYSSLNGVEWKKTNIGKENNLSSVTYGNDKFIAVGSIGVFSSSDGITWTHDRDNLYWTTFWSICFGKNQYVAVGPYTVASSKDGVNWVSKEIPFRGGMGYLSSVVYSNERYTAVGGIDVNGSTIWSSENGLDWKSIAKVDDLGLKGNVIDNQIFFAGNKGLLYSEDGIKWGIKKLPQGKNSTDITSGNNMLVVTGLSSWDGNSPVPSAPVLIIHKSEFKR